MDSVHTDIGDNESWHTAKLPPGEKTIEHVVCVYVCTMYIMECMFEKERKRENDVEVQHVYVYVCVSLEILLKKKKPVYSRN